jgi:hypothetical protein
MQPAPREGRGAALLLEHCAALAQLTAEPRPPAGERLAAELGPELARRLVDALAGQRPMRCGPVASRLEVA